MLIHCRFQLKDVLSEKMGAPASQLCVIFTGKILKDEDTVESTGLKEGLAVHLVIRTPKVGYTDPGMLEIKEITLKIKF